MPETFRFFGILLRHFQEIRPRNTDFDGSEIRRENQLRGGSSSHQMLYRCSRWFAEVLNHQQYVQMSNPKKGGGPGCLGFFFGGGGDEKLPSYVVIITNHYKDPQ